MIFNAIIEKDKYGYFAEILELDGCVSEGKTYEEALKNIREALKIYLETLDEEEKKKLLKRKILSFESVDRDDSDYERAEKTRGEETIFIEEFMKL